MKGTWTMENDVLERISEPVDSDFRRSLQIGPLIKLLL